MSDWDGGLWWVMIATGVAAAGLSITASYHDRRGSGRPSRRMRFVLHMISYVLLSVSVLAFVLRGLLGPS